MCSPWSKHNHKICSGASKRLYGRQILGVK
jgi:hypothetical protein